MTKFNPKFAYVSMAFICINALAWQIAQAGQTQGKDFAPAYESSETVLALSGVGVLRYLGLISIYDGALYLPPEVKPDQVLDDVSKRLEVKYIRSFKAEDFGPATIAGIKKNVDPKTYARLESRIAYHNALYEDIAPGDRVALTYIPFRGTTLEINGEVKGMIQGADFAEALFSMWLGEKPFDKAFKKALLGEK